MRTIRLQTKDRLERHSLLMFLAALSGHFGNYIFHALTGRMLSLGEYGLMIAVLGALQIFHLPLNALSMALAQNTAAHPSHARHLFSAWSRILLIASLLSALMLWTFRLPLLAFFSSSRLALIPVIAILITLSFFVTLTGGILQGRQQFRWLAARALTMFLLRAGLVLIFLLWFGTRTEPALLAHLTAMLATFLLSVAGILYAKTDVPPENAPLNLIRPIWTQTLKALPALTGFAILMTADVVLVRHFFPADSSGLFAQSAVLARMVLWLPLPIAAAMYPKVITPGDTAQHTLHKAAFYTLALLAFTLAAFWFFAPLFLNILYGTATPDLIHWTRRMALAMSPLGFTHVILQFELAQKRFAGSTALLLIALLYLLRVHLHHPTIDSLILTLTLATTLSALLSIALLARTQHPRSH